MKFLANLISFLAHPIFLLSGMIFLFMAKDYIMLEEEIAQVFGNIVLICTTIIPLIAIVVLKKMGIISSLRIPLAQERKLPYIITFSAYFFLSMLFNDTRVIPQEITHIFKASSLSIAVLLLLLKYTKSSAHTAAWGGVVGALLMLMWKYDYPVYTLFTWSILFTGLVMWSRLYLSAHTQKQVYEGLGIGFFSQVVVFLVF